MAIDSDSDSDSDSDIKSYAVGITKDELGSNATQPKIDGCLASLVSSVRPASMMENSYHIAFSTHNPDGLQRAHLPRHLEKSRSKKRSRSSHY